MVVEIFPLNFSAETICTSADLCFDANDDEAVTIDADDDDDGTDDEDDDDDDDDDVDDDDTKVDVDAADEEARTDDNDDDDDDDIGGAIRNAVGSSALSSPEQPLSGYNDTAAVDEDPYALPSE